MHFIQPEMPTQNCFVESFNGTFRDGCLNASWFVSLADACRAISSWRRDYKRVRPHSSLGDLTRTSSPPPPSRPERHSQVQQFDAARGARERNRLRPRPLNVY
jgi:transposase InsO family protein